MEVQAWEAEAIHQLLETGLAEVEVLILNQSPKPSGKPSPFLYRLYRKLDRIFFKSGRDAFDQVSVFSVLPHETPKLEVTPNQKRFSDSFQSSDLQAIEALKLDILLRFGFRILEGGILTAAKWGVWSYHHGDPRVYRGGPPAFWEVMRQLPVTGMALIRLTEKLDEGPILYHSWTQTDPLSVQRNANRIFWQSSFFVARVLKRMAGEEAIDLVYLKKESKKGAPLWKPPGNFSTVLLVGALLVRNALRKAKELIFKPYWQIGWVPTSTISGWENAEDRRVTWLNPNQNDRYWADPFCLTLARKDYVFVEAFDKKKKKGTLECILPEGSSVKVLEEPWHLSYPFVWEEDGEIFLIPESAEAGKIFWYRAVKFPDKWERIGVFFDQEGYDPTLWKDASGYWLFVNQRAHPACSPFDELFLYHSTSLTPPSWTAHPHNPIVSDVRRSRPAGRLFMHNGTLYRPGQDSGLRYGHGIQLHKILTLSLSAYEECPLTQLYPRAGDPYLGIHTFNQARDKAYLDFYSRK